LSLPAVVTSQRLRLVLITADEAADMMAGRHRANWHPEYPREDDRDAVSMGPVEGSGDNSWGPRHVVRAFDGLVVGSIGTTMPGSSTTSLRKRTGRRLVVIEAPQED